MYLKSSQGWIDVFQVNSGASGATARSLHEMDEEQEEAASAYAEQPAYNQHPPSAFMPQFANDQFAAAYRHPPAQFNGLPQQQQQQHNPYHPYTAAPQHIPQFLPNPHNHGQPNARQPHATYFPQQKSQPGRQAFDMSVEGKHVVVPRKPRTNSTSGPAQKPNPPKSAMGQEQFRSPLKSAQNTAYNAPVPTPPKVCAMKMNRFVAVDMLRYTI